MGRYSSDSDSSRGDRRSRNTTIKSKRSRSSSSSSSTSRSYQKKSYKHKHSRGRRSRSRSKSRHDKSKQHSHSDTGGRTHGTSRSKNRKVRSKVSRSKSRERGVRSRSVSRSKDRKRRSKSSSSEQSRSRGSPDSKAESGSVRVGPSTEEQLRAKLQKAIRAAQSADDQLRQQGLLSCGTTSSSRKEELLKATVASESSAPEPLESILSEINDAGFIPKHFASSKSTPQVLLDQPSSDMPIAPDANIKLLGVLEEPTRIFHSNLFLDPEQKLDKWIKKLFHLRQKAINGEPLI